MGSYAEAYWVKYTREFLAPFVASSISVAEVARSIGIKPCGGSATNLAHRIAEAGLDTSHFLGMRANSHPKHYKSFQRRTADEILVRRVYPQGREDAHRLTRALLEIGVPYECAECGQGKSWNGKPLTLQVDHVDGDPLNNLRENLRFICPNCHTQTPTFSLGTRPPARRRRLASEVAERVAAQQNPICPVCADPIGPQAAHCRSCAAKIREAASTRERPTKIEWPSDDDLRAQVTESSFLAVGRALGVSDNAIRKRLRKSTS